MISPLGPRGQVGVSRPMATLSLAVLEILVKYDKTKDEVVIFSESRAMIEVKSK